MFISKSAHYNCHALHWTFPQASRALVTTRRELQVHWGERRAYGMKFSLTQHALSCVRLNKQIFDRMYWSLSGNEKCTRMTKWIVKWRMLYWYMIDFFCSNTHALFHCLMKTNAFGRKCAYSIQGRTVSQIVWDRTSIGSHCSIKFK